MDHSEKEMERQVDKKLAQDVLFFSLQTSPRPSIQGWSSMNHGCFGCMINLGWDISQI